MNRNWKITAGGVAATGGLLLSGGAGAAVAAAPAITATTAVAAPTAAATVSTALPAGCTMYYGKCNGAAILASARSHHRMHYEAKQKMYYGIKVTVFRTGAKPDMYYG